MGRALDVPHLQSDFASTCKLGLGIREMWISASSLTPKPSLCLSLTDQIPRFCSPVAFYEWLDILASSRLWFQTANETLSTSHDPELFIGFYMTSSEAGSLDTSALSAAKANGSILSEATFQAQGHSPRTYKSSRRESKSKCDFLASPGAPSRQVDQLGRTY